MQEVLRGQPLQHHGGRRLIGNAARQLEQGLCRNVALLGVGTGPRRGSDPVPWLEFLDPQPDLDDFARGLAAGREWQARRRIEPIAEIDVDEVDADGVLAKADLALARLRQLDLL